MFDAYTDNQGRLHVYDTDDVRDGPGRRRRRLPGQRRGHGFRELIVHQPNLPFQVGHNPVAAPAPVPVPVPAPASKPAQGVDMRTALDALGALLPAGGQLIAAFRNPPDRPKLTGQPEKDLPMILDYVADSFDHNRTGAQTAGVLATTGAIMEILASL